MNGLQKLFANMFPESVIKEKAAAEINNLPDSAFLFVESGGQKDEDGKTTPRSLRHLPYKNADGSIDHGHLTNALSRLGQPDTGTAGGEKWLTAELRKTLIAKGQKALAEFNKSDKELRADRIITLQNRVKEFSPQYAVVESFDIQTASRIMGDLASLAASEANQEEPDHVADIGKLIKDIQSFISDEIDEMINGKPEAMGVYKEAMTEKFNDNHDESGRFSSGGGGGSGSDKPKFTHSQRVKITGNVSGKGKRGIVKDIAPSGKYFNVHNSKGEHLGYYHESDLSDAEEKEGKRHSESDQTAIQKAHDYLDKAHDHLVEAGAECMRIEKEADGHYRWWLFTTNSYEDTDKEIVSQQALEEDIERMDKEGDYGAVRFWHIGQPNPLTRSAGPGLDIGRCDFVGMIGRVRVDSGTFYDDAFGAALADRSKEYGSSIGFFHPESEPDTQGVYHHIHSYERSFLPRAKAANQLTALSVIEKENNMGAKIEEKMSEFVKLAGSAEKAAELIEAATQIAANAEKLNLRSKEAGEAPDAVEAKAKKKPAADDAEAMDEEDTESEDNAEEEDAEGEAKKEAELLEAFADGIKEDVIAQVKELITASDTARAEKEGKEITALKATVKEQAGTIETLQAQVAKLTGTQPKAIKQGFRASTSEATKTDGAPKVKEAAMPSTAGVPQGLSAVIDMIVGPNQSLPTQ